ncbi:acyltransferase family protein [Rhizobium sp. BK060]|uniref:acyltransferase family protein n=1 Tax=Rhizobium sp. BK060 TaxID=2587096 RepID=UPI0016210023|nr:acyltransferase family protein [Rhizobium sp. BK060]MBB3396888.1 peptidoglycan/LPS O-acetylase OafA/YrhL [Rhizobium sp. BK060]
MDGQTTSSAQRASGATKHRASEYQAYIDGLRAVAVSSVVLFHAFPGKLPGGFVGVDVFFVISGYLITGIIISALQTKDFSLTSFYARRVKRIFPALFLVLFSSAVLGWFILFPDEYSALGRYIFSGGAFISNLALWRDAGYFDTASSFKPLLHLWSLGIEEQFYIFWPLVLMASWKLGKRSLILTTAILLGSLAWCVYLTPIDKTAAFYSPISRVWELIVGALLAQCLPIYRSRQITALKRQITINIAATVGSLLLVVAVFRFDGNMDFPGAIALLPTAGTALIIASGPTSWVARYVLSIRFVVAVGLISYPLYLWHWPIIVFSKIVLANDLSRLHIVLAIVASFAMAILTYLLIEKPIRFGRVRSEASKVVTLSTAVAFLSILGLAIHHMGGFPARVGSMSEMQAQSVRTPAIDKECEQLVGAKPGDYAYCRFANAGGNETVAIMGDSHAHTLFPGISALASRAGKNTLLLANSACPSLVDVKSGINAANVELCGKRSANVINYLTSRPDIKTVIISTRGTLYMTGHGFGRFQTQLHLPALPSSGNEGVEDPANVFIDGLQKTIASLRQHGKSVSYFLENPEMDVNPQDCVGNVLYLRRNKSAACDAPLSAVLERQAAYRKRVSAIAEAKIIDPLPILCKNDICSVLQSGKLLYADSDHLSVDGSYYVAERLFTDIVSH